MTARNPAATADHDPLVTISPSRRVLVGFGVLGTIGALLGVLADIASGFATGTSFTPTGVYGLGIETVAPLLEAKTHDQLVIGHVISLVGLPLGVAGLQLLAAIAAARHRALAALLLVSGSLAYAVGTAFHASFGYIATALRLRAAQPTNPVAALSVERFEDFYVPHAIIFVIAMVMVSGIYVAAVAGGHTVLPRWAALANPITVQVLLWILALVVPSRAGALLFVTAYNLSLVVLFGIATWFVATPTR